MTVILPRYEAYILDHFDSYRLYFAAYRHFQRDLGHIPPPTYDTIPNISPFAPIRWDSH